MIKYEGKNSWWIILIFVIYNILPLVFILYEVSDLFTNIGWLLFWVFYYGLNLIWIPVFVRNRVELFDNYFIFYYGFGKEKIVIKDILEINRSRNPIASSANSLDRIHIVTKDKDFYISLKDNDDFINEIKQRII
ncbi:PH domain-containing protein [uncultured Thomasclavelia sp.]|uniref:PH domain-containing protein n=1 Tax=uncultured Thomasclavelia sp. TaxID=3025759 RepID=UPI0026177F4B|nr:PH domain-containing protein [uncultured Thomasclavelia sp.]WRK53586.1 PH domain-containing protein [Coprobacillaceae bacterium CR2/5/TPMF4]